MGEGSYRGGPHGVHRVNDSRRNAADTESVVDAVLTMSRFNKGQRRALVRRRSVELIERIFRSPWPARVQRFSTGALGFLAARFPQLAAWLRPFLRSTGVALGAAALRVGSRSPLHEPTAAVPTTNPPSPPAVVPPSDLLTDLRTAFDWQVRAKAAAALSLSTADGVVGALADALHDSSVEVAIAAVDALGRRRESTVSTALLGVVRNESGSFHPLTRAAAVGALAARLGDDELDPVLGAVRDVEAEVSLAAIAAIGERRPEVVTAHLLPIVEDRTGFFLPLVVSAARSALDRAVNAPAAPTGGWSPSYS